jgi:hypothetical protein
MPFRGFFVRFLIPFSEGSEPARARKAGGSTASTGGFDLFRISLHDAGGIGKHLDHGAALPPPILPRRSGDLGQAAHIFANLL